MSDPTKGLTQPWVVILARLLGWRGTLGLAAWVAFHLLEIAVLVVFGYCLWSRS
jgi:hypothetical protein